MRDSRVRHRLVAVRLGAKLAIAFPSVLRQNARCQRIGHRATGLARVRAIAEAAFGGKRGDLAEDFADALRSCPELQFAHTRSIDQRASAGQRDKFAMRSGVAAAAIGLAEARGRW